ncbi:hypothetical protein BDV98DRAFT_564359 [Pterulicium gracile]|uniref:Uncharacterized protein n=1 Tax=Pterulicium gracile TaxID=1884261 RepID=A0A5C3QQ65_9AGAR|nr:hypothetical protein BDV98DRAFT_564359 [Pterula gracilis]
MYQPSKSSESSSSDSDNTFSSHTTGSSQTSGDGPGAMPELFRSSSAAPRPLPIPPQMGNHTSQDCYSQMSKNCSNANRTSRAPSTMSHQSSIASISTISSTHVGSRTPPICNTTPSPFHDEGTTTSSYDYVSTREATSDNTESTSSYDFRMQQEFSNDTVGSSLDSGSLIRGVIEPSSSCGSMSTLSLPSSVQQQLKGTRGGIASVCGGVVLSPVIESEVGPESSSTGVEMQVGTREERKERPTSMSVKDKIRELEAKMKAAEVG